ncbi:hypothetical protein B9Z55_027949 [Caenorhabditis nigoni]|uniref:Uncharacterized protein n=1 Tax=Caenorhabditis nigoni TaxID=1611254 RepID=A0A2G5SDG5_9PELO|nr:hypothetical protein B9Z55_027949 [Caenorhabditis nigoni]
MKTETKHNLDNAPSVVERQHVLRTIEQHSWSSSANYTYIDFLRLYPKNMRRNGGSTINHQQYSEGRRSTKSFFEYIS